MNQTPFQIAATKAFSSVLDELENFGLVRPFSVTARREALRSFQEKIAAQDAAFRACVASDDFERSLYRSRAEQALEAFVRSMKERYNFGDAREMFWSVFEPPAPTKIP